MGGWPPISIVTPSLNQGRYIAETIESVMVQDYRDVEHIVIDGGSTDNTLEILKRYPHLRVVREPGRSQADAINKGFRLATGEIWGFLNSDDTLLPGTLQRVAREIDPGRGRHIVMGRCRFTDEHGRFIGIEHPSHFESRRRVLEIWKGHAIPQPAVFWTPEVWKICGPMDLNLKYHLDYDLFCRFSRKYRFHLVDQVFATYRLHSESKTEQWTERDRLEDSIRLSRRHWGSPFGLMYWQLALSLAWYRFNRAGRAREWLRRAQEAWRHGRVLFAVPYAVAGAALGPEVVFYVGVYPTLRNRTKGIVRRVLHRMVELHRVSPQTAAYLERTDLWDDGWTGPRLVLSREGPIGARSVSLQGWVNLNYMGEPFVLTVRVDGDEIGRQRIEESGDFSISMSLPTTLERGLHTVDITASTWFVPHRFVRSRDFRPLAWRFGKLEIE